MSDKPDYAFRRRCGCILAVYEHRKPDGSILARFHEWVVRCPQHQTRQGEVEL